MKAKDSAKNFMSFMGAVLGDVIMSIDRERPRTHVRKIKHLLDYLDEHKVTFEDQEDLDEIYDLLARAARKSQQFLNEKEGEDNV